MSRILGQLSPRQRVPVKYPVDDCAKMGKRIRKTGDEMQQQAPDRSKGQFTFVLHTHLPYVLGHGTWPHGTDWLNEATAECYIPLLRVLDRLEDEGIPPAITINLSPILCEQLSHPAFIRQFDSYLTRRVESSEEERLYFPLELFFILCKTGFVIHSANHPPQYMSGFRACKARCPNRATSGAQRAPRALSFREWRGS